MFDRRAVKEGFSHAAAGYDAAARLQHRVRARCIELAGGCWPRGAHILDAGCGTGALAQDIRQQKRDWRITGLDLAPGMCVLARGREEAAINADAAAMPFADAQFDGVFSSLMLQWADDPLKVLREMARVIRPGGHLVLSTLTAGTLRELGDAFAALGDEPPVTAFLPAPEVLIRAAHAGFALYAKEEETIVEHYPDCLSLMRSLKSIGASDKRARRRKGLMTPYRLRQVERAYAPGVPATWNVLTLAAEKR